MDEIWEARSRADMDAAAVQGPSRPEKELPSRPSIPMFQIMNRLIATTIFVAVTSGVSLFALARSFPVAWNRFIKRTALVVAVFYAVGMGLWAGAISSGNGDLRRVALFFVAPILVSSVLVFLSTPLWALPLAVDRFIRKRKGDVVDAEKPVTGRRALLVKAAGTMPTAAALAGPVGTVAASLGPVLRKVDVPIAGLDPRLDGFKILQMTDIHLGFFIGVNQVKRALEKAKEFSPDLVLLTGDIADDYKKLPTALEAVSSFGAKHGAYAILGNHEIYRGRQEAIEIYKKSNVELLVEDGAVLDHDGARLFVGGTDDPARLGGDHREFLAGSVERTLAACPSKVEASVLMCHRPEGFEPAADAGVTLTLAGHTHGGQAAIFGRSIFGWAAPRSYLLGLYRRGGGHLYTSAGLGHWFPFRFNCPTEAALVTLRRA